MGGLLLRAATGRELVRLVKDHQVEEPALAAEDVARQREAPRLRGGRVERGAAAGNGGPGGAGEKEVEQPVEEIGAKRLALFRRGGVAQPLVECRELVELAPERLFDRLEVEPGVHLRHPLRRERAAAGSERFEGVEHQRNVRGGPERLPEAVLPVGGAQERRLDEREEVIERLPERGGAGRRERGDRLVGVDPLDRAPVDGRVCLEEGQDPLARRRRQRALEHETEVPRQVRERVRGDDDLALAAEALRGEGLGAPLRERMTAVGAA